MKKIKKPDVMMQFVKGVSGPPLPDVDSAMRETIQKERIRKQRIAQATNYGKKKGK